MIGVRPNAETRAKMSAFAKKRGVTPEWQAAGWAANTGRPLSAEHRAKISAALKGKPKSPEHVAAATAAQARGAEDSSWKGDDVGYSAMHTRARRLLPKVCAHCGTTNGQLYAALDHVHAPTENLRTGYDGGFIRTWSISTDDYVRLCGSCHIRFDHGAATHCAHGHPWDEANTGILQTTGLRYCRACNRERSRGRPRNRERGRA